MFATLETAALIQHRSSDTLSGRVWAWFGSRTRRWTWRRILLLAAMVWLTIHFVWG